MDIVIDLETLDTRPTSTVLSIGLVSFNDTRIVSELYLICNAKSQATMKRTASKSTEEWWAKQAGEAAKVLTQAANCEFEMRDILEQVSAFVYECDHRTVKVWGNGSHFDISIMESLYETYQKPVPWSFWNVRDLRTFVEYVGRGEKVPKPTLAHNALEDAKVEAEYIIRKRSRRQYEA